MFFNFGLFLACEVAEKLYRLGRHKPGTLVCNQPVFKTIKSGKGVNKLGFYLLHLQPFYIFDVLFFNMIASTSSFAKNHNF